MKDDFEQIYLKTAGDWRSWLVENHNNKNGIWLIYYKKHTGRPRVPYNEAVEEALCFGWIDSTVKRIDEDTYMQKFTPRKLVSKWSEHNKKRAEKMIKKGKMEQAGMQAIEIAKKNGKWDEAYTSQLNLELSSDLLISLKRNSIAFEEYLNLSPSQKKYYNNWVMSAKKPETRMKRYNEMIGLLEKGQKLGMK